MRVRTLGPHGEIKSAIYAHTIFEADGSIKSVVADCIKIAVESGDGVLITKNREIDSVKMSTGRHQEPDIVRCQIPDNVGRSTNLCSRCNSEDIVREGDWRICNSCGNAARSVVCG